MGVQDSAGAARADDLDVQCRPVRACDTPRSSTTRNSRPVSRPLCAALGVIAIRSGRRETTALKLPLVPSTQPRA
jgi:hypothetical protein